MLFFSSIYRQEKALASIQPGLGKPVRQNSLLSREKKWFLTLKRREVMLAQEMLWE